MMIRPMQLADVVQVYQLERSVQSHPWTESQFRDAIASYQCTVIEKNHQVVGFCIMQPVLDEANLLLMAIHPKVQGQGLGYQLLEDAVTRLGADCVQIFLEVRESNKAAIALYEKSEFHQIDLRKNYYPMASGGREHAIIMVKSVNTDVFNFKVD